MKILIITEPFVGLKDFFNGINDFDAGQPAFYQVVKYLDTSNHEVFIITSTNNSLTKKTKLWKNVNILAYRSLIDRNHLKLGERIRLGDFNLRFLIQVLQSVYYGLKISRKYDFDLVVGHWEFATLAAYIVAKFRGIPNISRLYGSNLVPRTGGNLNLKNILLNLNRVIPFITPADLYICTQDGTQADKAADYFKIPKRKFIYLLNGVEGEEYPISNLESDTIEITFIGHLQSWKNPMRLLELASKVINHNHKAMFNFVGNGYLETYMKEYVQVQHLEDYVKILGRLSQSEKNKILIKTDIYVSFYSYSNLSNTLLEALAFGKAILTVNEGDTGLILKNGENAILLTNWNENIALEKLLWLVDHPEERKQLGKTARNWARKNLMNWEERAKLETQFYEQVIKDSKTSKS